MWLGETPQYAASVCTVKCRAGDEPGLSLMAHPLFPQQGGSKFPAVTQGIVLLQKIDDAASPQLDAVDADVLEFEQKTIGTNVMVIHVQSF